MQSEQMSIHAGNTCTSCMPAGDGAGFETRRPCRAGRATAYQRYAEKRCISYISNDTLAVQVYHYGSALIGLAVSIAGP